MNSLVTIAIASYNNSTFIERCVDSVINQKHQDLEVLIIDDGSKDNTIEILEKYTKDRRVRIIAKENGGLSSVRQMALDQAKGVFICFIDADDYLKEDYVSSMLEKIQIDHSDICVCSTCFEDERGARIEVASKTFSCKTSRNPIESTIGNLLNEDIVHDLHLSDTWNKMYRMEVLKKLNVRFCMPKGLNGTDTMFNLILSLHGLKYSTISDEEYIHVIYKKSAVHRKNKDLKQSFRIICDNMIEECKKLNNLPEMQPFISKRWNTSQYIILEDIYYSTHNREKIIEAVHSQKKYAKERNLQPLKVNGIKGKNMKAFLFLYNNCVYLLPLFFYARGEK